MNSRSGDRVPAGVSGEVGRGTVGTDAPTTPTDSGDLAFWLFGWALWLAAAAYAVGSITIAWIGVVLAPWGLLLLVVAAGMMAAAAFAAFVAFGISRLKADPA